MNVSLFFRVLLLTCILCPGIVEAASGGCDLAPFENRDYAPECLSTLPDAPASKHLSVSEGSHSKNAGFGELYFDVESARCADLDGDGSDEAVVQTRCGYLGANYSLPEYFVFAGPPAYKKLLDSIGDERAHEDFRKSHPGEQSLWPLQEVSLLPGAVLEAWFYAGGPHCCPERKILLRYVLEDGRLVLSGEPRIEPVK